MNSTNKQWAGPRGSASLALAFLLTIVWLAEQSDASVVLFEPSEPLDFTLASPFLDMDIDANGSVDFVFFNIVREQAIRPQGRNQALTDDQFGTEFTTALSEGSFIGADPGSGMVWTGEDGSMGGCTTGGPTLSCPGNFLEGFDFVGLEFEIDGQTHYGWLEVESFMLYGVAMFHRWAYETEPGVGILAGAVPEPSASVLLLVALAGLVVRRRRR